MLSQPRSQLVLRTAVAAGCLVGAAAATAGRPGLPQSLREVLARTADYCVSYGAVLSTVIADERFEQELVARRDGAVAGRRRLDSEIAFVVLARSDEWLAFRNVLHVDGTVVPDAAGRLERLFRETPGTALARAKAITDESGRYNLGPVARTFNVPTTVLHFLLPQHQDRFRFRKLAEELVDGEPVWVVEFREQDRGTFIRTPEGRRAPARGRIWIAPHDGRVLRTLLTVKADVEAEVEVTWRLESRLMVWVPVQMRESYRTPREAFDMRGHATYSNYRRFEVDSRIVR